MRDAEYHRRRLLNLRNANAAVKSCMREHAIGHYLAGQVIYNLGEYPKRFSIAPTEYDRELLKTFAGHGVGLIQLHEEWHDSQRLLGGDKYTSHDPEGLRELIDVVHSLGMKIILYLSTGFFEATDPDFDPSWAHPDGHLVELYFDYAKCSPASPSWRAYLLPRVERVMDEYGLDGLYNDAGYAPLHLQQPLMPGHVSPGPETEICHSAFGDLMGLVSDLVHKRGGLFKMHVSNTQTRGLTNAVYDYLWVGESVGDLDELREKTKDHFPYVVPCLDQSVRRVEPEDDLYLHAVPYMQFPLRVDGRPVTGERALVEGVNYRRGDDCWWSRHMKKIREHYLGHPDGPYTYGWWDSCPGRADARERWFHHFHLYQPMVKEGSRAWLEIAESTLFAGPIPEGVTASLFVNDTLYLVLANYGSSPATLKGSWIWKDRESGDAGLVLELPPRKLLYLERVEAQVS